MKTEKDELGKWGGSGSHNKKIPAQGSCWPVRSTKKPGVTEDRGGGTGLPWSSECHQRSDHKGP